MAVGFEDLPAEVLCRIVVVYPGSLPSLSRTSSTLNAIAIRVLYTSLTMTLLQSQKPTVSTTQPIAHDTQFPSPPQDMQAYWEDAHALGMPMPSSEDVKNYWLNGWFQDMPMPSLEDMQAYWDDANAKCTAPNMSRKHTQHLVLSPYTSISRDDGGVYAEWLALGSTPIYAGLLRIADAFDRHLRSIRWQTLLALPFNVLNHLTMNQTELELLDIGSPLCHDTPAGSFIPVFETWVKRLPNLSQLSCGMIDENDSISIDLLAVFMKQSSSLRGVGIRGLLQLDPAPPILTTLYQRLAQVPINPQRSGPGIRNVYLDHVQMPIQVVRKLFDIQKLKKLGLVTGDLQHVQALLVDISRESSPTERLQLENLDIVHQYPHVRAHRNVRKQFLAAVESLLSCFRGLQKLRIDVNGLCLKTKPKWYTQSWLDIKGIWFHRQSLRSLSLRSGNITHPIPLIVRSCPLLEDIQIIFGKDVFPEYATLLRTRFEDDAYSLPYIRHLQSISVVLKPDAESTLQQEFNTPRWTRVGLIIGGVDTKRPVVRFLRAYGGDDSELAWVRV